MDANGYGRNSNADDDDEVRAHALKKIPDFVPLLELIKHARVGDDEQDAAQQGKEEQKAFGCPAAIRKCLRVDALLANIGVFVASPFACRFYSYDAKKELGLAFGEVAAHAMRKGFLKNNANFLREMTHEHGHSKKDDQTIVRGVIREWIEESSDWRNHCSLAQIDEAKLSTEDPYVAFNSPVVAIELGLGEVLLHLVEEMGVNINDGWKSTQVPDKCWDYAESRILWARPHSPRKLPLRCACDMGDWGAFSYLVSKEAELFSSSDDVVGVDPWLVCRRNGADFLQALLNHPSFPIDWVDEKGRTLMQRSLREMENSLRFEAGESRLSKEYDDEEFYLGTIVNHGQGYFRWCTADFLEKLRILLEVGMDPSLATEMHESPADFVRAKLPAGRDEAFWQTVGRVMEEGRHM